MRFFFYIQSHVIPTQHVEDGLPSPANEVLTYNEVFTYNEALTYDEVLTYNEVFTYNETFFLHTMRWVFFYIQ